MDLQDINATLAEDVGPVLVEALAALAGGEVEAIRSTLGFGATARGADGGRSGTITVSLYPTSVYVSVVRERFNALGKKTLRSVHAIEHFPKGLDDDAYRDVVVETLVDILGRAHRALAPDEEEEE